MLCDNLTEEGEPCNECSSCKEILETGDSHAFREMDAANNSGKENIQRILENMQYYTLGGSERRIYLIDECHRLSKAAMDALLKPMEDNIPGSENKRLVCLFCTTEPEKLRTTIKTRCMVFPISEPDRESVVSRLGYICEEEEFEYTRDGLDIIYQEGNGHIRDMINAVEKIGRIEEINAETVKNRLGLSARSNYYKVLLNLGDDVNEAISVAEDTLNMTDADSIYEGIGKAAMDAYRLSQGIERGILGGNIETAESVYERHGEALLSLVDRVLESQKKITSDVLQCELLFLHKLLRGESLPSDQVVVKEVESESAEDSDEEDEDDEDDEEGDGKVEGWANEISPYGSSFANKDCGKGESEETKKVETIDSPVEPADEEELQEMW